MLSRQVTEEAVDGGQTDVTGGRLVLAGFLQVLEEVRDLSRPEVVQVEAGYRPAQAGGKKAKQQLEGVPITQDGVGTDTAKARQVVGEEVAQTRGEQVGRWRSHRAPPGVNDGALSNCAKRCSKRSDAEFLNGSTKWR